MDQITELIAEGKGKRLYATENPDEAVVYYRDETFAFHGLKRGRIIGKGEINNLICEYMFTLLKDKGVPNHFIRRIDNRCSLVKRVEIIPVTVKVRNIVAGSLAKRIGYPDGTKLKNTVVEHCLKDPELEDPLVNLTHITAMGLATPEEIEIMSHYALRVNEILCECMREINIELIDFKLEFVRMLLCCARNMRGFLNVPRKILIPGSTLFSGSSAHIGRCSFQSCGSIIRRA